MADAPFDCDAASASADGLAAQIAKCVIEPERFDWKLVGANDNHGQFSTKCFASKNVSRYVDHMGKILQRKRFPSTYEFRSTNVPRRRADECIWRHAALEEDVRNMLMQTYDYFEFCHVCMGGPNELRFDD